MNKENIMDGKSLNPQEGKLKQLQEILPEAFTEGKIDWERLKAALGEDINFSNERYVLNWAGKSDAFKVLQTPSRRTLIPVKDESVNFDETGNIFIEGENLEVLKVLQKSYFGKIKMIYTDPPYNTGNDSFIYPDNFSESADKYRKRVGDTDENGYMTKEGFFRKNSKENGQYHSNWLNMMYPRLFLAKNLLRQDGIIFVSIDDNEVHNLRLMMNEVFGEENFVGQMIWKRRSSSAMSDNNVSTDHEYVICFQKGALIRFSGNGKDFKHYSNPDNDPRGPWASGDLTVGMTASMRPNQAYDLIDPKTGTIYPFNPNRVWLFIPESMKKLIDEGRVIFPNDPSKRPMQKRFQNELKSEHNPFSTLMMDRVGLNTEATRVIREIMGNNIFDYSKPLSLLKTLIPQVSASQRDISESDIILDFFAGSATLAHAVLALNKENGGNRKFICVQLPELCDEKSEAYKAGYKTIADIAKERIRRAIKKIKEEDNSKIDFGENRQDLGFKVLKLADSNFKQWRSDLGKDADALKQQLIEFVDPVAPNAAVENMVYELLLKSGKDLNSTLEHKENYCCVNHNELVLMLEKANQDIVDAVLRENPQKVIALDRIFEGNDPLKSNTALQMRDAGIEFKTI